MTVTVSFVLLRMTSFVGPANLLVRPAVVAAAAGIFIGVVCAAAIRREVPASFVAATVALAAIEPIASVLPAAIATLWYAAQRFTRARYAEALAATRVLSATRFAGLVLLSLSVGGAAVGGGVEFPAGPNTPIAEPARTDAPDIYVIILDGYARADTLRSTFAYDNDAFQDDLGSLGFDVYSDSTSNYNATLLTLVSMFSGSYIDQLGLESPASGQAQARTLRSALAMSPMPDLLRSLGYEIVAMAPPISHTGFNAADREIAWGAMTDLEVSLLAAPLAGRLFIDLAPDVVLGDQRDAMKRAFAAAAGIQAAGRPLFLLAHFMVPHPPFIFDHAGGPVPLPLCFPERCHLWEGKPDRIEADQPDYAPRYVQQLRWVNERALELVNTIVSRDPTAVVVIMGDHGSRLDSSDIGEEFRNLLAVRSPGHPRALGDAPTLVNLIPSVLNAYFDEQLAILPAKHYYAEDLGRLLELRPWP